MLLDSLRTNRASSHHPETQGAAGGGGSRSSFPIVLFDQAPRVANVTISNSNSDHAPYSFDTHNGSGIQLRTVPVGRADTIAITVTEDVNIEASDLQVSGLRTFNRPTIAAFDYDAFTMTATWRFTNWASGQTFNDWGFTGRVFSDHYALDVSDSVTDVEDNPLDGEWTNP